MLRDAHGLEELEIERKARGKVQADVPGDITWVSALHTTSNYVRSAWRSEDEARFLTVSHKEYMGMELEGKYEEKSWILIDSPERAVSELGPAPMEEMRFTFGAIE